MAVVTITPPAVFVSLNDAKAYLKVDHSDDDALISTCIAAAQGQVDGPQGWLRRAVGMQTLELVEPDLTRLGFCGEIVLPYPPIVSVVSVTWGAGMAVDSASFRLGSDGILKLLPGFAWPWPYAQAYTARIRYMAGYATVPAPIVMAVLLMVADLYLNRDGKQPVTIEANPTLKSLLSPFRVWSF